ncbi:MAG TPA: serine hydrolase domain-containing protein [Ramlibacter sp.]|nr:serine hydrolase domain-containing protein [Ramlibacter sp.]
MNARFSSVLPAASAGFDAERLQRVRELLDQDIAAERYDGATLLVARDGELAFEHTVGFADRAQARALQSDDVFVTFSIAKQFVHALVLNRIERGDLMLTTRVTDLIPEFGCRGKENITVWHLLTHTSGLPLKLPAMPDPMQFGHLATVVAATCASMVEFIPGERVYYSGIAGAAILGELLRRAEGSTRSLRDLMAQDLFEPLGMKDTSLGLRADLAPRLAPVIARDRRAGISMAEEYEMMAMFVTADAEIPALGCVSTAADMMRFATLLRNRGQLDGQRLLSPAMLELALRNQTGDKPNEMLSYTLGQRGWQPFPASLGLGFFLRGAGVHPHPFGTLASASTYGGLGAGSNMFWVDPQRDVSCVFMSAGLVTDESRNIDRLQRISDAVLASAL